MHFVPFRPVHLKLMEVQPSQVQDLSTIITQEYFDAYLSQGAALSAFEGHVCIGCAGVVPMYGTRAIAWAFFGTRMPQHCAPIVKKIRSVLNALPFDRIEMAVDAYDPGANRFARAIGMKLETPVPLRKHGAHGQDENLYARVRDDRT